MAECELTAKSYFQLEHPPGAARVIGEMELVQKVHGFYLTAITAAQITAGDTQRTLIAEAENVLVTKTAQQTWVAGDWIYWDEAASAFTNIPAAHLYCVGKAQRAAGNAAVIGFITLQDNYHPVRLGTSAVPVVMTAGQKQVEMHQSSAIAENVEPFVSETTLSGVGATGGRARFQLNTNAVLGGWANALKALTDFKATGAVSGLGSAFCAELIAAAAAPAGGHYAPLEAEIRMPSGAGVGAGMAYLFCNVQDTDKATFQGSGYFAIIENAGDASDGLWYSTNNGTTDGWLRIRVNGVDNYIMCSLTATEA